MIIETYNKNINDFIYHLNADLNIYNIKFLISVLPFLLIENTKVNGYFDEDNKTLAIAIRKPVTNWLPTLVHESCHFDQWKENIDIWQCYTDNCNMEISEVLNLDFSEHKDFIKEYYILSKKIELDCEKRTAEKIEKFNLPINKDYYIQQANAYVLFYKYLELYNNWYVIGKEPYNNKSLVNLMSKKFDMDYDNISNDLIARFHECTKE